MHLFVAYSELRHTSRAQIEFKGSYIYEGPNTYIERLPGRLWANSYSRHVIRTEYSLPVAQVSGFEFSPPNLNHFSWEPVSLHCGRYDPPRNSTEFCRTSHVSYWLFEDT
jgi:hypothetical protein